MHGTGLAQKLMTALMDIARDKGLGRIEGEVLKNNANMLKLMKRLGFDAVAHPDDASIKLVYKSL
jgi:acetyltransferase